MSLSQAERLARLRLARSGNVGPITFRHLLARFVSARAALEALPDLMRRANGRKRPRMASVEDAEAECAAIKAAGAELLLLGDAPYPKRLAAIEDAPPVLIMKGRTDLLAHRTIGMVGARNASAVGRRLARALARDLASSGLAVASGLARGIDAAAHEGSIDCAEGGTIAVLGAGIDVPYPRENRALHERIAETGLLLSEHPPGTQPQASHFPRRNRIIAGLSLGVVVVEAALRSGSLITARLAGEQGREVFAVPGSPLDPRARGTNNLIRQGATLVEDATEILEALDSLSRSPLSEGARPTYAVLPNAPETVDFDDADSDRVRAALSPVPIEIDEVVRASELTPASVLTILLELELAGAATRHPGNRVSLA